MLKTRRRERVVSLDLGPFVAVETVRACTACGEGTGSRKLAQLVAPGCNFAYDVVVYVGRALFVRHRNEMEVVAELAERNVSVSPSEIGLLGRRFIGYLAVAHEQAAGRIQEAMALNGGYVLHLDGTHHGRGPVLMSSIDGLSDFVLLSRKLPSEKAERLIPFLERIRSLFGTPLALVQDMGAGILKAVSQVFPGRPVFICHLHFLRDAGKDLLAADYDEIRKRLRKHEIAARLRRRARALADEIRDAPELIGHLCDAVESVQPPGRDAARAPLAAAYSLVLWTLDGKRQGRAYGFPFDRPLLAFAQRLRELAQALERVGPIKLRGQWRDNKIYYQILNDLRPLVHDAPLWQAVERLESKIEVFDKLREAMRIAPPDGSRGLNDNGLDTPMPTIRAAVEDFRQWLVGQPRYGQDKRYPALIAQLDDYGDRLFADPLTVQTPDGPIQVHVQRTNNTMEHFFRDQQRDDRRKTGHKSFARTLTSMLADTPLVKNLDNPDYMTLLLDGRASLAACFAQIDAAQVRHKLQRERSNPERIPIRLKQLVALPVLPQRILEAFSNSNGILAQ